MKVARGQLLAKLTEASIGLSKDGRETVQQSNCFCFRDKLLTTFNGTVMVRVASPLDFDCVVNASDLLGLLSKVPDDVVELKLREGELIVRDETKRRSAGIATQPEFLSPTETVPRPTEWRALPEGVATALQQAARTCAKEDSQHLISYVHVAPDMVEGCDDSRLLRVKLPTGFPTDILIPADAVAALEGTELARVALADGWAHFRTAQKAEVSVLCTQEAWIEGVDAILKQDRPEKVTLPANLAEILERAEVCHSGGRDHRVAVRINNGELVLTARKEGAWYKERKLVEYRGRPLAFEVNPKFLVEVLKHTRDVRVDDRKLKISYAANEFVVVVNVQPEQDEAPKPPPPARNKKAELMPFGEEVAFQEADIPF